MQHGEIKVWKHNRGFGFIKPDQGDQDVFLHISNFTKKPKNVRKGDRVAFHLRTGKQGKPEAYEVMAESDVPSKSHTIWLLLITVLILVMAGVYFLG